MKIGELSARTGVSIRSLRYYEKMQLLTPVRGDNGYREFSPLAEEQVRTIRLYLALGLSTEQIASFLHCVLKNKEAFCEEVLPVYERKLAEIDGQIRELSQIRSNLLDRIRSIREETNLVSGGNNDDGHV
ncbi:MerR family transcriptional regulator [Cohnella terricola]|uniref:MerR family transcriptional regulator n=1 Tax=Cohnella terricola TaxID=1289167 RepID=A0A559JQR3_9BACL|nr:MerR family transcriptional regulator [Cohnella terricola]TVY02225.1 MerR family transcriptional regulator [Cohnella terricola]